MRRKQPLPNLFDKPIEDKLPFEFTKEDEDWIDRFRKLISDNPSGWNHKAKKRMELINKLQLMTKEYNPDDWNELMSSTDMYPKDEEL